MTVPQCVYTCLILQLCGLLDRLVPSETQFRPQNREPRPLRRAGSHLLGTAWCTTPRCRWGAGRRGSQYLTRTRRLTGLASTPRQHCPRPLRRSLEAAHSHRSAGRFARRCFQPPQVAAYPTAPVNSCTATTPVSWWTVRMRRRRPPSQELRAPLTVPASPLAPSSVRPGRGKVVASSIAPPTPPAVKNTLRRSFRGM